MTTTPPLDGFDTPYALPNAAPQAAVRWASLEALYDDATVGVFERCGVAAGWQCLEVGGGGGSVARWLAGRVGASGHVLVTDIDTRFLDPLAGKNVEVRRHDIAADSLPASAFDLVHTRLVLHHLPGRDAALQRMVSALKPGGWLVIEEFDVTTMEPDAGDPSTAVFLRTRNAVWNFMTERGWDGSYGRQLWWRLRDAGLANTQVEGRVTVFTGGSAGARFLAGADQMRDVLVQRGAVSAQDMDAYLELLADPDFAVMSPVMVTAWGRRPRE